MTEVDDAVVAELVGNAHGNLVRVRELLDAHPAALNLRAPWNETAVEAATQMGNKPILELLIARGAPVDQTSDLYSVGVVLYELLTGVVPFSGDTPVEIAMKHLSRIPDPPSSKRAEVPRDLDLIVMRALAKDPSERYQSAEEMDADLARVLEGLPVDPETETAATAVLSGSGILAAAPTSVLAPPPAATPTPAREEARHGDPGGPGGLIEEPRRAKGAGGGAGEDERLEGVPDDREDYEDPRDRHEQVRHRGRHHELRRRASRAQRGAPRSGSDGTRECNRPASRAAPRARRDRACPPTLPARRAPPCPIARESPR